MHRLRLADRGRDRAGLTATHLVESGTDFFSQLRDLEAKWDTGTLLANRSKLAAMPQFRALARVFYDPLLRRLATAAAASLASLSFTQWGALCASIFGTGVTTHRTPVK